MASTIQYGLLRGIERLVRDAANASTRSDEESTGFGENESSGARTQSDYDAALASTFSRNEIRSFITGARLFIPGLNREQYRWRGLRDLQHRGAELGVRVIAQPFSKDDGQELLGFYSPDVAKPLVYLNNVHHPAAVAATFFHEIGHHLVAQLLTTYHESRVYSLSPEYNSHLDEPSELLADLLVCLQAYPKVPAKRIFAHDSEHVSASDSDLPFALLIRAKAHLVNLGFQIDESVLAGDRRYLSGMIHFLKLRLALLKLFGL